MYLQTHLQHSQPFLFCLEEARFAPLQEFCRDCKCRKGIRVQNRVELAAEMRRLLRDRDLLLAAGQAAGEVVTRNRGALERSLELIGSILSKP